MNQIIISGIAFSIPLLSLALSGIFSERSGVTNLAVEGFQGVGAFIGAFIAVILQTKMSGNVPYYVALLTAFVGGCIYALLHAVLCIK